MADFDFSQLPEELIHLVMKLTVDIEDFVRFGATCKSWQSVVAATSRAQKPSFNPLLMLTDDETDAENLRSFSCLSTHSEITVRLPDIHGRKCWGSPYGWLFTFGLDSNFHLLNPFTGARLPLPHPSTLPNQFTDIHDPEELLIAVPHRFVLSSNPSLPSTPESNQNYSCIVIAVYNPDREIAFAKPGDEAWTRVETPIEYYKDAIYFNGQIYAIDSFLVLTVCDINVPHPKGIRIEAPPPHNRRGNNTHYLLEICAELHLIERGRKYVEEDHYITIYFAVFKFDFQTKSWIEVSNLGDHALFVGNNTSFIIAASDYLNIKSNAIYHTDDHERMFPDTFCDMSVYDYGKKTLEPFHTGSKVHSTYSRPVFLIPSL